MPSNTHSIAIRVEPEVRDAIERAAKADQRSLSSMVAKVLADWAKTHGWLKETKS